MPEPHINYGILYKVKVYGNYFSFEYPFFLAPFVEKTFPSLLK